MLNDAQKQIRFQGIGGSDAAAILGVSQWRTPMDVYLEKVNHLMDDKQTQRMKDGSRMEPLIVEEFEEETGKKCEIEPETLFHKEHKFMLGNIDRRIIGERAILECKATKILKRGGKEGWGDERTDEIPQTYLLQVAHYAMIEDCEIVYIAVKEFGEKVKQFIYKRNHKLEEKIKLREKNFWENHVLKRIPPPAVNLDDVKSFWADAGLGKKIISTERIENFHRKILKIKALQKKLEKAKDAIQFDICSYMRECDILENKKGNTLFTWKNVETKRFDSKSFKEANPELYEKFSNVTKSRMFLIKGEKE